LTRIDDWCDEATFVDWEQSSLELPVWQTSYHHVVADGQVASLTDASEAHAIRALPVEAGSVAS
jgi:predicted carbohydrate-binding protein with CBM5 and CBM33 domain